MLLQLEPTPEKIKDRKNCIAKWDYPMKNLQWWRKFLGRLPNYTETGLFSVMWSEHCSYKNSKPVLRKFPTTGDNVLQGPGEGAGIVDIGDDQAVVFKIESHNHPSAIEPYQGAATGVGGIIRDVFSMGARPIAILNSLRFGELDNRSRVNIYLKKWLQGLQDTEIVLEFRLSAEKFNLIHRYEGNPLVNAMCVGLINHEDIQKRPSAWSRQYSHVCGCQNWT